VLAHIKGAARELLGQLADVALEYPREDLVAATDNFAKERCLGAGGAGAVYRGKLRGGTDVAVKVLADRGGLEGFEDEVRALSKFRHPNLVTLFGWGQHGSEKYILYELLPGGDLQGRLRGRKEGAPPFTWQDRLRVALGAASGLAHMASGQPKVFHRDIKPPNILLDADGTAKMADFGLAAAAQEADGEHHLSVEHISGTPGYTCPTYVLTRRVTEQSEAYSFGIVLLELLVNQPPALVTNKGDMLFPLLEAVKPAAAGAHPRLLAGLDASAGWPSPLVEELADWALACVDLVPARRPGFEAIAQGLRALSRNAANGGGAPVLPPPVPLPEPPQRTAAAAARAASRKEPRAASRASRSGSCRGAGGSFGTCTSASETSDGELRFAGSEVATADEAEVELASLEARRGGACGVWWH